MRGIDRRWRWAAPVLLALIAILYLCTLSVNHTEAEDSLWYLRAITYDPIEYQFHPNHLLYGYANWLLYRGWGLLGYTGDAELPVKLLNVTAGLVVLALVYRLAAAARLPHGLRLAALLATASAYGFWWYSVECETYIVPLVFVMLALDRLMKLHTDFGRLRHHLLLGVFVAAAALFHQQHALLAGVVLLSYLLILARQGRAIGLARWAGRLALCGAVCAALVAVAYVTVLITVYGRTTPETMLAWLSSGGEAGGYGYGLSLGSLKAIIGFGRATIGGHFMFAFPPVVAIMTRLIPNYDLREEIFLVADFGALRSGLLVAGLLIVLLCAALLAARRLAALLADRRARGAISVTLSGSTSQPLQRNIPSEGSLHDIGRVSSGSGTAGAAALTGPLIAYLVLYATFNTLYLPESIEVWIALLPALGLALGLALRRIWAERAVPPVLGLGLACLLAVNLWGSVLPQTERAHDYWYQFNAWLLGQARRGDLVVSGAGYISDGYIAFYSGARVLDALSTGRRAEARFDQLVAREQPQRIFISSTVADPPRQVVGKTTFDATPAQALFERLRPALRLVHSDRWQSIYQLAPASP